jgi:Fuc2NAc and GlcNAc transferase
VIEALLIAALVALVVAAGVAWLVARNAAPLGLLDVPNERSSHQLATPRGGGIGIVAGVLAGTLALAAAGIRPGLDLAILLVGIVAMAALGAVDDRRSVPVRVRLLIQLAIAIVVVVLIGGIGRLPLPPPLDVPIGLLATPLAIAWLATVTNFYNFMDGIDGLAGGQAIASCAGVAIAAWSFGAVQLALVMAAASLGFLFLNRPPARIFLGDVGSTSIGFGIAGLPLLASSDQRPLAVFAVAIGLALFLLDPLETIIRLALSGRRVGIAHRAHSYQALAITRDRHRIVSSVLVLVGFGLSFAGAIAYHYHSAAWPVLVFAVAMFAVERFLAGRARAAAGLGRQ